GLSEQDQQRWQKLVDQASRLAIQQQWEEAVAHLEKAVTLNERHAETHFRLATALLARQRHAEALVHFRQARDEDVCPLRALTPLAMTVRKVAGDKSVPLVDFEELLAGRCQDQNGHSIVGADYFLDHVHPTIEGHRLLAEAIIKQLDADRWWNPGQQWNEQARQQVSRRIFDSVDQADHARARRNLAKVLNWSGKHMEAGVLSLSVLEQLPNDLEALSIAAAYMRQLGRIETAIDYLSRRNRVTPDDVDTLRRLSSLLVEAGQLEEALSCQQQVTRLQPNDAQAFHHLGMILAELKRFAEATVHYRKAIELDKSDANMHYHLGIALAEKLDLEGSRDAFQQALRLSPEDHDASFNLAVIHGQLGQRLEAVDPEAARRHYRSALELEPGMTDIQDRLQGLEEHP
ncbi:MAG: tetratricopeptide repeat protein, partial [Pirellulaceae bacterium]